MTAHSIASSRLLDHGGPSFAAGVWRIADPKITLASVASMVVGAGAAAHDGPISWGWLGLTVLGIFCVEAAKNASGEVVDWDSGTDQAISPDERTPFSGGKRVLVDGLLTRRQTIGVAAVFYAIAIAIGVAIAVLREPAVIWLGMAGVALAFFYHAPPLRLAYRGLGELAVALSYGPIIAAGTYLVQRHAIGAGVLWASVPLGIAIAAFLWINELPDARADAAAGKRTLVVRLGRERSVRVFGWLVAIAFAAVAALPLVGLPWTVWFGLLGLGRGMDAAIRLRRDAGRVADLVPAQASTLLSFVIMSAGIGAGFLLGGTP